MHQIYNLWQGQLTGEARGESYEGQVAVRSGNNE